MAGTPSRRERAAHTRRRMLDAAFRLFAERGYQGTTIAEVGEAAGVAEQTVYFTFHSKSALFQQVLIHARTAPGEDTDVTERGWFTEALEVGDQRRALALVADGGTEVFRRLAPLAHAMAAAELVDPDVGISMDVIRAERRKAMTSLIAALEANGPLAVPAPVAVDVLDVVQSIGTFNAFVAGCGWTVEAYKAWAYLTLTQLLPRLPPARAAKADLAACADLSFHPEVSERIAST